MKIDKELIEKYHRQECSTAESEAVEQWLFSSDSDEALQLPGNENKVLHKQLIWNEIESAFSEEEPPLTTTGKAFNPSFWTGAVAASLIIGIIAFSGYLITNKKQEPQSVTISNPSSIAVKHVEASLYDLSVGTNTSASINNLTGAIDLAGSILIRPKENMELKFEGRQDKINLKKGQTYIILKGNNGVDKIIIVNENNLMDLPPVIQKQIINEFKI